ncbi:hypothetical protein [Staphylococcus coagulans]|uniref:hypothetical protein n=1 Tax=Staphylococcus coagulans TaxID=74706 RepID=UPI003364B551
MSVIVLLLLFGSCGSHSDDDETEDTKVTGSHEKDDKKEKETEKAEKVEKESKENKKESTETTAATPQDNTVYGKLTEPHDAGKSMVVINGTTYLLGDTDNILQAEKSFGKFPVDRNIDKEFLDQHARDYMQDDAEFVSNISDIKQKYHSKSLNKDYCVSYILGDKGQVLSVIVSSLKD